MKKREYVKIPQQKFVVFTFANLQSLPLICTKCHTERRGWFFKLLGICYLLFIAKNFPGDVKEHFEPPAHDS